MHEQPITVGEEVKRRFSQPPYANNQHNPRIYVHDALHAILGRSARREKSELIVAIYQAVLLRDTRVDRKLKDYTDGKALPTPEEVKALLPQVDAFIAWKMEKIHLTPQPVTLTEDEITLHYHAAQVLDRLMKDTFGKHFRECSLEEIKALPLWQVRTLVEEARRTYRQQQADSRAG